MDKELSQVVYSHEYPRRLKAAFIGCGGHAFRNVYSALQYAPVELVAVCDLKAETASAYAAQFGAQHAYTDHRAMLRDIQPEVVFIVTDYDEHGNPRYPQLAADCVRAGAHAWIEKPPAASVAQVEQMIDAANSTGKQIGVGLKKMFFPANRKAHALSRLPEFGQITSVTARYPQALPPFEDRGDQRKMVSFLDHMVHPHSLLKLLCGSLEWLFVNRSERNGAAVVSMRFRNGIIGTLHFSHGQGGSSFLERTEIVGEGANIVVDNNIRVTYYRKGGGGGSYGRSGDYFGASDNAPLVWEPEFSLGQLYNKGIFLLGYVPEILHFTTRLLNNEGPEYGTLEDAREMLRVYDAYRRPDEMIQRIAE
ncbi:MAG: Gfo/Idh/MocA family oxidoreductase [Armatimonadota bacterium]